MVSRRQGAGARERPCPGPERSGGDPARRRRPLDGERKQLMIKDNRPPPRSASPLGKWPRRVSSPPAHARSLTGASRAFCKNATGPRIKAADAAPDRVRAPRREMARRPSSDLHPIVKASRPSVFLSLP
ncbi:hypothetical protein SKAU_G00273090 [Synaphobranchus kaupii]|uniref:Uncharacterized protein n=1 Tax=Synaphobranchus kaupii TaxID=118154 RepID=A0A9Q1IPV7_SYNKA|nr:hypothetical protein SKAU_G00273090 [Synaphobranchus kaupii]